MSFLVQNPKVDIVALCDIYQPSIDEALKLAPKAKVYGDYRELLENNNIDAILVATPLSSHCKIVMDAFDAGKHVFCEKTIGFTMEECFRMYNKHRSTGKIFFTGQQRLFDPRYIKAMEMIHAGTFGEINAIRTFWYRNGDWRRPVPSANLERQINWRLYKEYSKGLMTELACHQLQIGSWALNKLPEKVMGHGAITYWKDGREVYDNVSCLYVFDDGVKMTFDSVISNQFYGLEEQIMGNLGTVEPEKGKYYFESIPPAPGFLQMINDWENKLFDSLPFAGTSWAPETANENKGELILGERPKSDGTSLLLEAFVEAVITRKQPAEISIDYPDGRLIVRIVPVEVTEGSRQTRIFGVDIARVCRIIGIISPCVGDFMSGSTSPAETIVHILATGNGAVQISRQHGTCVETFPTET